ncbi:MAG: LysR family transcriptional regulator [Pseudomonadota bacterium]
MDKLDAMRAFVKVVALGSFAEAARQLSVTRSAVSKGVKELESGLGARLLDRTTRRVNPTEAGLAYYERCLDILARIEETEFQVTQLHEEPRGVLKVNAPMSFGTMHLGHAISAFMELYPQVRVELMLTDRFIDPIEEGFDVTVRIAQLEDSSLIARKLAPAKRALAASPEYLEQYGRPEDPAELMHHACLNYGHTTTRQRWVLERNGKPLTVPIQSIFCANNGEVLRDAALAGRGITLLPTFLIGQDIAKGRLEVVLPDYQPTDLGIFALYAPNRFLAAKVRVFIDFLKDRFGMSPDWDKP